MNIVFDKFLFNLLFRSRGWTMVGRRIIFCNRFLTHFHRTDFAQIWGIRRSCEKVYLYPSKFKVGTVVAMREKKTLQYYRDGLILSSFMDDGMAEGFSTWLSAKRSRVRFPVGASFFFKNVCLD